VATATLASRLRSRVDLLIPVPSEDGYGGSSVTWGEIEVDVPAEVLPVPMQRQATFQAGQAGLKATHVMRLRYREDIPADARVRWQEGSITKEGALAGPVALMYKDRKCEVLVQEDSVRCQPCPVSPSS
jgi:SPP1 family predicted phage head-tail adaptor